jgi:lysophospholipase L1-like esterase
LGGCSKSPVRPTPVVPPPDPLTVICPDPLSQPSSTGLPVAVRYGTPTAAGGTPPVQITCAPPSESTFPVGSTTVTCTGVDSKAVTGTCSFVVTLVAPPRLISGATTFVAFGDSITEGEITVQGEGGLHTLTIRDDLSYPTDLRLSLAGRYTAQPVLVVNSGVQGESTSMGLGRISSVLAGQYQVLLLMEGANDIGNANAAARDRALGNLRAMVRLAKGRGLRVFLGTLPPQNPLACCPRRGNGDVLLPSYNAGIVAIAAGEGVALVDVFTAFNGDVTTLIGPDGLHPSSDGYQAIAAAFFKEIKTTLEAPTTPASALPSRRAPFFVLPRKR